MAEKEVYIGSVGPFLYDDSEQDAGVKTNGAIEAQNVKVQGLSANVRLVASNADKETEEVNDLTQYIGGNSPIEVEDDSDGTVTIKLVIGDVFGLVPEHTDTSRDNISGPSENSLIYNTDQGAYQFHDGTEWRQLSHIAAP